jgi:endonuclease/exonuclease/phosphatase family metal-dependent hydrolase
VYGRAVALRILTWNLYHGRAQPPAGHDLLDEFSASLAAWEWDVALLQEVPPWWPEPLAAAAGAQARRVLTSRNALLPLRRAIAVRRPDLIKSNGGGANAILVRPDARRIAEHRTARLCLSPERRWLQAVCLDSDAGTTWVGNLHATVHDDPGARRDAERARRALLQWAAGAPCALGGDFNVRTLALEGFSFIGGHDVDLVFAGGLEAVGGAEVLERGRLSDHAPLRVNLRQMSG